MLENEEFAQRPVAEVEVGDKLASGVWVTDEVFVPRSKRFTEVTHKGPCPGYNGMHVHLNAGDCYDSRALVTVKK